MMNIIATRQPNSQRLITESTDLLIIGAGCSGLALAKELSERQWSGKIVLIEKKTHFDDDKTWCFWADPTTPWYQLAKYKWHTWYMSLKNSQSLISKPSSREDSAYCCIPSMRYYEHCLNVIKTNPNVELYFDTIPTDLKNKSNSVLVTTKKRQWLSRTVVDTRPPTHQECHLYQSFYGAQINLENKTQDTELMCLTDALNNYFSSRHIDNAAGLMPELSDCYNTEATVFDYHLPFSKQQRLLERTWIGKQIVSKSHAKKEWINNLAKYLESQSKPDKQISCQDWSRLLNKYWNILVERDEYGCLPMGFKRKPSTISRQFNDYYLLGGISADLLRPSSGYGFLNIQRWAVELSDSLIYKYVQSHHESKGYRRGPVRMKITSHHQRDRFTELMDRIFIDVISNYREQSSAIFIKLFKNSPDASFIRLMNSQQSSRDWIKIILAVPKWPFVLSATKLLLRYLYENTCKLFGLLELSETESSRRLSKQSNIKTAKHME